jgi:hypothetical protein
MVKKVKKFGMKCRGRKILKKTKKQRKLAMKKTNKDKARQLTENRIWKFYYEKYNGQKFKKAKYSKKAEKQVKQAKQIPVNIKNSPTLIIHMKPNAQHKFADGISREVGDGDVLKIQKIQDGTRMVLLNTDGYLDWAPDDIQ